MAEPVGALNVQLTANAAQFERDMGRARRSVTSASSQMRRGLDSFKRSVRGAVDRLFSLRSAAAVAAGATGLFLLSRRAIQTADEIGKTARAIGVTAETLQELRFAAGRAGISMGQFDSALAGFSKRVGEAQNDTGQLVTILRRMNPELLAQVQAAENVEQAFNLIINAAAGMGNELQRNALLAAAFGRSAGVEMANMIRGGTDEIERLRQRARDLGVVLSDDVIARAEQAADELGDMGKVLSTAGTAMALEFMPLMRELARLLTDPRIIDGARGIGEGLASGLRWVVDNKEAIVAVMGALAGARLGRFAGTPGMIAGAVVGGVGGLQLLRDEAAETLAEIERIEGRLDALLTRAETTPRDTRRYRDLQREIGDLTERLLELRASLSTTQHEIELAEDRTESYTRAVETLEDTSDDTADAIERIADMLKFERAQLHRTERAQRLYTLARQAGIEVTQEFVAEIMPLLIALDEEKAALEAVAEAMKDVDDEAKRSKDIARELGMTFSSAFEDAIVGGRGLSDVLRGLEQDLMRLLMRRMVTEPLFGAIGDLLPGFQTGGSFMVGGQAGPDNNVVAFRASRGERVTIDTPGQAISHDKGMEISNNVTVNVHAPAGSSVEQRESAGPGGRSIDIIIDEITARNIGQPGSRTGRAMRSQFSLNPQLVGR